MLARQQRLAEAMAQLQAVLTPAESHYNLASVFEAQKRTEQAKAEYRKALERQKAKADAAAQVISPAPSSGQASVQVNDVQVNG